MKCKYCTKTDKEYFDKAGLTCKAYQCASLPAGKAGMRCRYSWIDNKRIIEVRSQYCNERYCDNFTLNKEENNGGQV